MLAVLLLLLVILLTDKNHWRDSNLKTNQIFPATATQNGQPEISIVDYNNRTNGICPKTDCMLKFDLAGQRVDKIFFSFNYGEAPDRMEIYGTSKGQETLLDSFNKTANIENLKEFNPSFNYNEASLGVRPFYSSYIGGNYDSIRVKIFPAIEDRVITVNDVFFYQASKVSTPKFLLNLLLVHQRSFFAYIYYTILFFVIIFSAGFSLIDKIFANRFKDYEKLFLSFATGLLFWGLIGLLTRSLGHTLSVLIPLALMGLSFVYFFINKSLWQLKIDKDIIKITLFFTSFLILYLFIFEGGLQANFLSYKNDIYFDNTVKYDLHPGNYKSDEIVPYGSAKILFYDLSRESKEYTNLVGDNYLSLRTQLFTYLTVPFLKVLGDRFFIFEILGLSCVILIPAAVYMLALNMTKSKRAAYLAVFFAFISPYLIYMYTITQIKVICTILLTAYFYFLQKYKTEGDSGNLVAASILASTSVLVHNFSIMYILAGIIYVKPNIFGWFRKKNLKDFALVLIPVVVFLSWLILSYLDSRATIVRTISSTKPITLHGLEYFKLKYGQNYQAILPYLNRWLNLKGFFISDAAPMIAYRFEGIYRSTIYSLSSFVLFPFFIISLFKFRKEYKYLWLYLLILLIITLNSDGNYLYIFGLHLYMVAAIPLILVLAAKLISNFKTHAVAFICLLAFSEAIFINFISYKELIDLQSSVSQFPYLAFASFLLLASLWFSPLYYLIKSEEN